MTQAFNLSQLANKVNTSGQLDISTGATGTLPIANGGTNNGSLPVTAGGVVYTDGSKQVNTGAGSSGQLLQSNGASAPTWVAPPVGGFSNCVVYTTSGTFDSVALNATKARITVIGGGGGAGGGSSTAAGKGGGQGGFASAIVSGLSGTYSITVGNGGNGGGFGNTTGASGQTSSFGSLVSATGGAGGGSYSSGTVGATGAGTVSSGVIIRQMPSVASAGPQGNLNLTTVFGPGRSTSAQSAVAFSATDSYGVAIGGSGVNNSAGRGGIGGLVYVEY